MSGPVSSDSTTHELQPRAERHRVMLGALIERFGHGGATRHRVRDLSTTGVRVDQAERLQRGATVLVTVGSLAAVGATVIWVEQGAAGLRFAHPAQQVVLQEQIDAIGEAERRRDRLAGQIRELVPSWSLAPVVAALQAMRGVAFLSAVVLAAEVGDFRRFASPRQLMAWLGLVPSEHSSGSKIERGGITKAGNGRARRVLFKGAWSYRFPARVTSLIQARLDQAPEEVRAIAWKAQLRLCARFRRLVAAGKNVNLVTTTVAREMAACPCAIACQVQLRGAAA